MRWATHAGLMFPRPLEVASQRRTHFPPCLSQDELPTHQATEQNQAGRLPPEGKIKQLQTRRSRTKPGRARSLPSRAPRASLQGQRGTHPHTITRRQPTTRLRKAPANLQALAQGALSAGEFPGAPAGWTGERADPSPFFFFFETPMPTTSPHPPSRGRFSPR